MVYQGYILFSLLLFQIVYGIEDTSFVTSVPITSTEINIKVSKNVIYVYPEPVTEENKKDDVVYIYPEPIIENVTEEVKSTTTESIVEDKNQTVTEDTNKIELNDLVHDQQLKDFRNNLYQRTKLKYKGGNKIQLKIKKKIIKTNKLDPSITIYNVTMDKNANLSEILDQYEKTNDTIDEIKSKGDDNDLITSESQDIKQIYDDLPYKYIENNSIDDLDMIPFTIEDAIKPNYEREAIESKTKDIYDFEIVKSNIEKRDNDMIESSNYLSMWSGLLSKGEVIVNEMPLENSEDQSKEKLLIIGPIPKRFHYATTPEPFVAQLDLPKM